MDSMSHCLLLPFFNATTYLLSVILVSTKLALTLCFEPKALMVSASKGIHQLTCHHLAITRVL